MIGPDNYVYVTIGDVVGYESQTQNFNDGPTNSNGTSGILRLTQEGKVMSRGIIGDTYLLNLYYAYRIRNSFGMDFDPLTNILWDTENGPSFGDEINLVEASFNSGWKKIQGIWKLKGATYGNVTLDPEGLDLVDFQGRGKYRAPEFTWFNTTGPTALVFLDSNKLGKQYQNDIFVGDYRGGSIYHFDLNQNRTHLALEGPRVDRMANTSQESQEIVFGEGFGPITDLQIGPDGYLSVCVVCKRWNNLQNIPPHWIRKLMSLPFAISSFLSPSSGRSSSFPQVFDTCCFNFLLLYAKQNTTLSISIFVTNLCASSMWIAWYF